MAEHVNLELKAIDPDPAATARACAALGAADEGLLVQRDTYFAVGSGRLKLRERLGTPEAELIHYERETVAGVRESRYRRVPIAVPDEIRTLLGAALGVVGVVEKERRLYRFRNVRIHLDKVEGLGTFVELEAVLSAPAEGGTPAERGALAEVTSALGLQERATAAGSYLELLHGDPAGRSA